MKENYPNLYKLFTDDEIERIKNIPMYDRRHPVQRLLFPNEYGNSLDSQVAFNTDRAIKSILNRDIQWLNSIKKRLLEFKDFSTASSALGEIRAYGYLLEAGVFPQPIPVTNMPTPEFQVEIDHKITVIEVHSKQMHAEETKSLVDFNKKKFEPFEHKVGFREHTVTPFGKPKLGESVTENAISKLSSIKQSEHQLNPNNTSIIWLDFQDELWDIVFKEDSVFPTSSFNGQFTSGVIWYAFYGWKGAPIYENNLFEKAIKSPPLLMKHNGRFFNTQMLDGVIITFPRATFILENPNSQKPIQDEMWKNLTFLPWFSASHSYSRFLSHDLYAKIENEKNSLLKLSDKLIYKW